MADAPINWGFSDPLVFTDVAAVEDFLKNIPAVNQEIVDLLAQNVLTYRVYSGSEMKTPTGAFIYQQAQAQFAQTSAEDGTKMVPTTIQPGGAYQQAYTGRTIPTLDNVNKIGIFTEISRERVMAEGGYPVVDALAELSNSYSDGCDGSSMTLLAAQCTTTTAGNLVSGTSTYNDLVQPIINGQIALFNTRLGYKADTYLLRASTAGIFTGNTDVAKILAFENDKSNPIYTGSLGRLSGVEIIAVPDSLCVGTPLETGGFLFDSRKLGGIAEQVPLNTNVIWLDSSRTPADSWFISLNHNMKPYVKSPLAGVFTTGLTSS